MATKSTISDHQSQVSTLRENDDKGISGSLTVDAKTLFRSGAGAHPFSKT